MMHVLHLAQRTRRTNGARCNVARCTLHVAWRVRRPVLQRHGKHSRAILLRKTLTRRCRSGPDEGLSVVGPLPPTNHMRTRGAHLKPPAMAVASSGAAPLMEHVTRMRGSLNALRTQSIQRRPGASVPAAEGTRPMWLRAERPHQAMAPRLVATRTRVRMRRKHARALREVRISQFELRHVERTCGGNTCCTSVRHAARLCNGLVEPTLRAAGRAYGGIHKRTHADNGLHRR